MDIYRDILTLPIWLILIKGYHEDLDGTRDALFVCPVHPTVRLTAETIGCILISLLWLGLVNWLARQSLSPFHASRNPVSGIPHVER